MSSIDEVAIGLRQATGGAPVRRRSNAVRRLENTLFAPASRRPVQDQGRVQTRSLFGCGFGKTNESSQACLRPVHGSVIIAAAAAEPDSLPAVRLCVWRK